MNVLRDVTGALFTILFTIYDVKVNVGSGWSVRMCGRKVKNQ